MDSNRMKKQYRNFVIIFILFGVSVLFVTFFALVSLDTQRTALTILFFAIAVLLDILFIIAWITLFLPICRINALLRGKNQDYDPFLLKMERNIWFEYIKSALLKSQEATNNLRESELFKNQTQFAELQSQINPHFLYNTLESIRSQALEANVFEVANMAKTLASFFRYSITSTDNLVSLTDEIRNVKNYFTIQQYRFGNKISLFINCDQDNCLENLIPKLTLQPVVENAIFHGLETLMDGGRVTITSMLTQSNMIITISDDGAGMELSTLAQLNAKLRDCMSEKAKTQVGSYHSGIALPNVNKRIKLCFGTEYGMSVRSAPRMGTDVEIVLPIIKKMNK